ncbi:MAG: hypothetical protein KDD82_04830, partial [Planctomycetes bacterium]|nr:hypothetical protein [Planctomycetota bacterium]
PAPRSHPRATSLHTPGLDPGPELSPMGLLGLALNVTLVTALYVLNPAVLTGARLAFPPTLLLSGLVGAGLALVLGWATRRSEALATLLLVPLGLLGCAGLVLIPFLFLCHWQWGPSPLRGPSGQLMGCLALLPGPLLAVLWGWRDPR